MHEPAATHFSAGHVLATFGIIMGLLLAAERVLGVPDATGVHEFAAGGRPSGEAALATADLLVWAVLVAVCGFFAVTALRGLRGEVARRRAAIRQGTIVMLIGIAMLAVGLVRHQASPAQVCCGSVQEASQSLGR